MEKRADAELEEAIKAVKVEVKLSDGVKNNIAKRYIGWDIMREGAETKKRIFQAIGEGPIRIDSWENKNQVRSAAKSAGLMLVRNKRKGTYGLIDPKKQTSEGNSYVFNPDLLDMIDDAESDQDRKVQE